MDPIEISYNRDLDALVELLASIQRPGSFYTSGLIEAAMPRLEVEGVGTIAFPVLDVQAKEIVARADRAPYGRGEETLVDTHVRKVWQVAPRKIRLGGKGWKETLDSIVSLATKGLGAEGASVSAQLYKLLLYDKGSFFVAHRDTEKVDGMFATLVVALPSLHEGGNLVVRHGDREATLDLRVESDDVLSRLSYAAFYADCEHEVRPITEGNRICLVYNLVRGQDTRGKGKGTDLQPPDYRGETARAAEILGAWAKRSEAPPKLAYLLEHQYSPAGLSFSGLKNADAAFGKVLAEAAEQAWYAVHLGIVHIEESGAATVFCDANRASWPWYPHDYADEEEDDEGEDADDEDFEIVEAFDGCEFIDGWVDAKDRPVDFGKIPLGRGELLPAGALDGEKPDMQRVREATGNEGGSYERAYHRAAIVLWHKSRYGEVLLQGGASAALPYLRELVESWSADSKRSRNSKAWRQIAALLKRILKRPAHEWRDSQHRRDMIQVLSATGDSRLLAQFVEEVVLRQFDGAENDELLTSCSVLGAKTTGELFAKLMTARMTSRHKGCIQLLERLAKQNAPGKRPTAMTKACRNIAGAVVTALPDIRSESRDRDRWGVDWHWSDVEPLAPASITTLLETLLFLDAPSLVKSAVDAIAADLQKFAPDTIIVPALAALHRSDPKTVSTDKDLLRLWQHAVEFLLSRSGAPPQKPSDWAQPAKFRCSCDDCKRLKAFASDPSERTGRFPLRKDRRRHLHEIIDRHDLDMTHETERRGSPYTLVCTKTRRHHQRRLAEYRNDIKCLKTAATLLGQSQGAPARLLGRIDDALGLSSS